MKSEKHSTPNTPSHWEILEESLHAPCKIFDVYKRHCRHPVDNREGDFYVIKSPDWALTLALTPEKELILVHQYRFSIDALSWEIPGGVLGKNESPITGGLRELEEETGFSGEDASLIGQCHPNPAIISNTAYFVLVHNCMEDKASKNWDHHEELDICTVPLDAVFEMVNKGEITHAITLNGLLFLKNYLSKST